MKNRFTLAAIILILFFSCKKTTSDSSVPLAEYTLGTGGNCTGAVVSGRFVADTPLTVANTITITVDVTVAGPYWITTNTVNGISFSQISTFTSIGPQTAVLTGTGTPVAVDSVNFTLKPLSGPGDSCTFSVATIKGIPPHYYLTCQLNGVFQNFVDSAGFTNSDIPGNSGVPGLDISGLDTVINSNKKIEFGVGGVGSIGQGIYTDTSSTKAYFSYIDSLGQSWSVNSSSQPSFTIAVTNISASYAQGTFSGTIKDQQGTGIDSITVTNGLFSVPVK
ncbi:MAG: hypothetical protein ABI863_04250 [Ginsengibacter sp.]